VKHRFIELDLDLAETLHPAEVVYAVHEHIRSQWAVTHPGAGRPYHCRQYLGQGGRATSEETEPPRSDGKDLDDARLEAESRLLETEAKLRFRVGLEALVTAMSTRLLGVHLAELPAVVQAGLGELCEYFGIDRAYALKVDQDFVFDLNVEWWGPDIPQVTTPVTELPIEAQRFWVRTLRSGQVVQIPDVDEPDEAAAGAVEPLRHDGVQSILFVPLLARGDTVGFLGLEARRSKCWWSDESIALMRTVGELFVNSVERSRAEQALETTARELEHRNEELERSNRELEQFASIVSHDLKSPLQVVRGFVELLGRDLEKAPSPETQTYVNAALRGAERMDRLIDDLLAYSRAGQRPTNFVEIDLNELMTEVLSDSAAFVREADASITVDRLPTVTGDHTQLRQLLQNLINNAVKFRRLDVSPEIHVDASEDSGWWTVRVEDNGIGVERRHREEIFGMFSRVHQGDRPGSGIGLAVCARVVANHNGHIWVEDGPDGGSALCFTLVKRPDVPVS
jgi:signal transduction histidine kinase